LNPGPFGFEAHARSTPATLTGRCEYKTNGAITLGRLLADVSAEARATDDGISNVTKMAARKQQSAVGRRRSAEAGAPEPEVELAEELLLLLFVVVVVVADVGGVIGG